MMRRLIRFSAALPFCILAISACSPDETPTAPGGGEEIAAPSLAVAANTWTAKAKIPTARNNLTAGVVDNSSGQSILYAIGGYVSGSVGTVEAYNFSTNTWTAKAPVPTRLTSTNGAGAIGGRLYMSGGEFFNTDEVDIPEIVPYLYVYTPSQNRWNRKKNMPWASSKGVTGVINNKLYVLVGNCGVVDPSECGGDHRLLRYDPATDTWDASLPQPPHAHVRGVGGVISGKFYVVGGTSAPTELDVYDPVTNSWTTKAPMPSSHPDAAGAVAHNKLFVIGGRIEGTALRTVHMYDPATNTWKTRAEMPFGRSGLAAAKASLNGQSYILAVSGTAQSSLTPANYAYAP
jgi:N-acetylneuraminic acid mutarotase